MLEACKLIILKKVQVSVEAKKKRLRRNRDRLPFLLTRSLVTPKVQRAYLYSSHKRSLMRPYSSTMETP